MLNQQAPLDAIFQALADPARRAMLAHLARGPATVSALAEPFTMSLPAVLQHLKLLEQAGLVSTAKAGRVRTCQLNSPALAQAQDWLTARRAEWEARFDRLDAYLNNLSDGV